MLIAGALVTLLIVIAVLWPYKITVKLVTDGDSIEGIYRGRRLRIRLAGYDAPEYHQPSGREARSALVRILAEHQLRIVWPRQDRYGRLIGFCWAGKVPLSWRMVVAGYGWPEGKISFLLSLAPRLQRKGLWSNRNRLHPSLWRRQNPYVHPADI